MTSKKGAGVNWRQRSMDIGVKTRHMLPYLQKRLKASLTYENPPTTVYTSPSLFMKITKAIKGCLATTRRIILHYHLHYAFAIILVLFSILQIGLWTANKFRSQYPIIGMKLHDANMTTYTRDKTAVLVDRVIKEAEVTPLTLKVGDHSVSVNARQLGARYTADNTVNAIYNNGRSGTFLEQLLTQDAAFLGLLRYKVGYSHISASLTADTLNALDQKARTLPVNAGVTWQNGHWSVTNDVPGTDIDTEAATKKIMDYDVGVDPTSLQLPLKATPAAIKTQDVQKFSSDLDHILAKPLRIISNNQSIELSQQDLTFLINIKMVQDPKNLSNQVPTLTFDPVNLDRVVSSLVRKFDENPESHIVNGSMTVSSGKDGSMIDGIQTKVDLISLLLKRQHQVVDATVPLQVVSHRVKSQVLPKDPAPQFYGGQLAAYKNGKPAVTFIFDGEPSMGLTDGVLDTLANHDIHAFFFLLGQNATNYPNRVKAIQSKGQHLGISLFHYRDATALSSQDFQSEVTNTQKIVTQITGTTPSVFLPPFNSFDETRSHTAQALQLAVLAPTIDSLDWGQLSEAVIVKQVLDNSKAGSIVLFHSLTPITEKVLNLIIAGLAQKGLSIN